MIEITINFYKKLEKDMSDSVRLSPSFLSFFMAIFSSTLPLHPPKEKNQPRKQVLESIENPKK